MIFSLTIDGSNREGYVDWSGSSRVLNFATAKNGMPDTLTFTLTDCGEGITRPESDHEVIMTIDGTAEFKGRVTRVNIRPKNADMVSYDVSCTDYTRDLKKGVPVAEIYRDTTIDAIILDLKTRYPQFVTFTINNVDAPEPIDYLFLDHLRIPQVLKMLADRVAYDFYIDKDKDLHFYNRGAEVAPFDADGTNGSLQKDTLTFSEDGEKIVNLVIVEGDLVDASETTTENLVADGSQTEFSLNAKYSGVSVDVATVAKTVGAFGLHDAANFDCLYDYNANLVIFRTDNKPTVGQAVDVTGFEKIPIIVQVDNPASSSDHGVIAKKTKDLSIKTVDSANQFALAELSKYADELVSGSFVTLNRGLRAGQRITISHSGAGISGSYFVQSTRTVFHGINALKTTAQFASAEAIDATALLAQLMNAKNRTISASQILRVLKSIGEDVGVSDIIELNGNLEEITEESGVTDDYFAAENHAVQYVLGDYKKTSLSDPKTNFILDGSLLS